MPRLPIAVALPVAALSACGSPCPGGTRIPLDHASGWEATLGDDLTGRDRLRILVFGDGGVPEGLTHVAPAMAAACDGGCDLALMLGDNFYEAGPVDVGDDAVWTTHFDAPLASLGELAVWGAIGNHGYAGCPAAQVARTFVPGPVGGPRWLIPDNAYAIPALPDFLRVAVVDTTLLGADGDNDVFDGAPVDREATQRAMVDAAASTLCDAPGWKVLVGHHPLYTTGAHHADADLARVRAQLEPLVTSCGVHLVLSGHDHQQELIEAPGGWLQLVEGAASKLRHRAIADPGDGATALGFSPSRGFAIVTVEDATLDVALYADQPGPPVLQWAFARDALTR